MLPLPSSDSLINEPMCDSQDSLPNPSEPSVPAVSGDSVKTLTKAELAELLFDKVGLNKREAKDLVDTFFEEIREVLGHGDLVKISGFGNVSSYYGKVVLNWLQCWAPGGLVPLTVA
jgi:hypothetical protein